MEVLRLYDPDRRPQSWTDIIRPSQFAVFSKDAESGATCDAEGKPLASPSDASCLVFERLDEARTFCEERVRQLPHVRFEVFDAAGRTNPPLVTIVSPSRADALAGQPRGMRMRKLVALGLLVAAPPLFWIDYEKGGMLILPTFLGINLIIIAARLLFMNLSIRESERARQRRLTEFEK